MNQVEHWIWLQRRFGAGSPKPDHLVRRFGSAQSVYEAGLSDYLSVDGLNDRDRSRLCDKSFSETETVTENCLKLGLSILTPDSPDYPERLREIYAPPCVLYVAGNLKSLNEPLMISMVGTRKVTEYGQEAATKIAAGLAGYGAVVVSGLAVGVDTASHKGTLKGGGRTVAVIGCGPDINYPAPNRELRRLIASNGAVVSEFPPGSPPATAHFPIRNRIIAGLSLGTVVVEAGVKSGSLITAGLAAEMGRDIFAVPGSIFSPLSEGTNRLLRDGAKPVLRVADILEEYEEYMQAPAQSLISEGFPEPEPVQDSVETGLFGKVRKIPQNLTEAQAAVYGLLSDTPLHVDELALKANLELRVVLSILTTLEIQGLAQSFPGRRFAAASA